MPIVPQAQLTVVAEFPKHYFLENLAVRSDGSILATALNKKELWCVPRPDGDLPVTPVLMHTFDLMTLCVIETDPDIFLIGTSDVYRTRELRLYRMDLRAWSPGESIEPQLVLELPAPKVGLNGGCLIAPDVLLIAGAADLIWRVDLPKNGGETSARVWLRHDNMKNRPGEKKPEQPGVNGIRYAARTHQLYYTSTSQQLMMRVKCRSNIPGTGGAAGIHCRRPPVGRLYHRRGCRGRLRDYAPREYH